MRSGSIWKDAGVAASAGFSLAVILAVFQPGAWLRGWLAFSALLAPGILILLCLWRWAGAGKTLAWIFALAFILRITAGVSLEIVLPLAGTGSEVQQAGYVFYDAYHRDNQAWELAASGQPLWLAFSKVYSMDQYGGLLGMSAASYRLLSPDVHRPLLVVVLAALVASLGVILAWKTVHLAWDQRMAAPVSLLLAVYPESILQGSSQMREPFLVTFVTMVFLGAAQWQTNRRGALAWLGGGFACMLLFSPGVALFILFLLSGWLWLRTSHKRISWKVVLAAAIVLILALILLWLALARGSLADGSPLEVLFGWLKGASAWDIYLLEQNSGWIQLLFETLPEWLQIPFVALYGLAQPVLPAVIADPTVWTWRVIGILRASGWYALIPFLVYSLVAVLRASRQERLAWLWLWGGTWLWMIIAALRAGADAWDNPRYRVMLLFLQAALAAFAWVQVRSRRDPWLGRILLVEGIFLGFFSEWYASRYTAAFGRLPFWTMVACIVGLSLLVILVGCWRDVRRSRCHSLDRPSRGQDHP